MENLTKVRFELEEGNVLGGETAWAERVCEGLYRLRNSPGLLLGRRRTVRRP